MYKNNQILEIETRGCFDFFWNEVSLSNETYGLIRDNTREEQKNMASIASVGFGLSAIVIGVERKYITYEEGYDRVLGTLKTLYHNLEHKEGFFYHFIDMESGEKWPGVEVSIIDTAIAIMGALTASEYFGCEIKEYFEKIYKRVNWSFYTDKNKNLFYMGYHKDKEFMGWWDLYAEQLMMYFLAVASPTYPLDKSIYYSFGRRESEYGGNKFIYTYTGSIFAYQFSHAFIDFRDKTDELGTNWFNNSIEATLASRKFCIDNSDKFKTYNENSWGMTACETPKGYEGAQGAFPSGNNNTINIYDGTIPPCGSIGSVVFTPKESIDAMKYYYSNFPKLMCKYGFNDAYNLDVTPEWYSECVIGIDKGISLLMIENYRSELIWNLTMKNDYIKKAFKILNFK